MKQIFLYILLFVSASIFFSSCEKDEIGGTEARAMAGEWYVKIDAVDADGEIVYSDDELFGYGYIHLDTYNTSLNSTNEIWIDDVMNFWEYKGKVNIDLDAMTFSATDVDNEYYEMQFTIANGKILYDATTTPSGVVADSIVFNINFNDDTYPVDYGFDSYRVSGFRYTGLANDD